MAPRPRAPRATRSLPLFSTGIDGGDVGGRSDGTRWAPRDLDVDSDGIASLVDKFRSLPGATNKARVDLAPEVPDQIIHFVDIPCPVEAVRGLPYPFVFL